MTLHILTPTDRIAVQAATAYGPSGHSYDVLAAIRVVTHEQGSWKWQDAHCAAYYLPRLRRRRTRRGDRSSVMVWQSMFHGQKLSWNHIDGLAKATGTGSLSQLPVDGAVLQGLALLEEMGIAEARVGVRS